MPITIKDSVTGEVISLEEYVKRDSRANNWTSGGRKTLSMAPKAVKYRRYIDKMKLERPEAFKNYMERHRIANRKGYRKEGNKEMVDLVCAWCKTPFRRSKSLTKKNTSGNFYCCMACSQKANVTNAKDKQYTVKCKYCGKLLVRTGRDYRRNKTKVFQCGEKCYL